ETFAEIRIPPNQRLDFIPSLLTKKALTWFFRNESKFETYGVFVDTFLSKYHDKHLQQPLDNLASRNSNDETPITTTIITPTTPTGTQNQSASSVRRDSHELNIQKLISDYDFELLVKSQGWSDDLKFKCVPTLLQNEVMNWYKRNSATITSWSEFEKQIKEEFTSRFKNRKAFERLLYYEESMNQLIKDYYNEIMDVCKESDPQMSETIKLQYVLTKVKRTLKLEVSKQFPETPAAFLNYGKQLAELMKFMKDDPTAVCVASAPQPSTSSRIHASINRNDHRLYVPHPRIFEQQQESNELHHLKVNRPVTPLPSSSQTSRNNPNQSGNAAANSRSNQTQHNLFYSRTAYSISRPPPHNYSGCHSCGSLDHYQRACPKRQDFP
ncbi:unnamed protein product, partial [Didymodactylos carnosus]